MSGSEVEMIGCDEALEAAGNYVLGVATQDRDRLAALFSESAHIVGVDEGRAISVPRDRWIEAMCAPERAGQGSERYAIVSVNLSGTVAVVVANTSYGRFDYCDVLTLLKHDGAIRITQKCFHQRARQD